MKPLSTLAIVVAICSATAFGHARAADPAAAPAANRYAATIAPAERFEVGGVLVERHGAASGRALILIPGLASGPWVWQDTIRAFGVEHPVYVLTLPGFDARPPAGTTPFAAARAAVERLIADRHLDQPVLVGHSLGGTLAFAVAEDQPAALGGIVSIEGLPVMPGTEGLPPDVRAQAAARAQAQLGDQPAAQFAAQQKAYMRTIGVMDVDRGAALAELTARSDPASVGRWVADVMALDLRPGLKSITAPVLVLAPYFDLDEGARGLTPEAKAAYYRGLLDGVAKAQVAVVAPSRHFATIDQPDAVDDAIRTFLGTL